MKTNVLYALFTLFSLTLNSQDGILDNSFGNNGSVQIPYYENNAQIITILKIGNVLFAGGYTKESKEDFTIIKMDLDGNLDSNFGENGTLRFVIGQGFGRCSKLLKHPDGGLMAIGWDRNINKDEYILIKMDTDGNLDSNYGIDGIASGNWDTSSFAESEIADAAFLSDGRLITAGRSYNGSNTDFVVACYDAIGNPCTDFGDNGIIVQLFNDIDRWEIAEEVVVDANDNIYVSGKNDDDDNLVLKYDTGGNLVSSFGSSGILEFTSSSQETSRIGDLAIDNDNRLIVSGSVYSGSSTGFISRYDSNGNRDLSFGEEGEVLLSSVISFGINDAKVIDNNALIIAGNTSGFGTRQVIVKLDNSGNLVSNFGTNGVTTIKLSSGFTSAREMAIDTESIYIGGDTYESDYFEFAVTKLSNQLVNAEDIFIDKLNISLYPNPVISQLNVRASEGMNHIKIYDISGKEVYNMTWSKITYNHEIITDIWQNGFYTIVVNDGNRNKTLRFIKI